MFTGMQFISHMIGDYITQSDKMATNKTSSNYWAYVHALTYGLVVFLFFRDASWLALTVITGTHFLIDRFRLARYVCWVKNYPWTPMTSTGYPDTTPVWLSTWLLIITDNLIHLIILGLALAYL